MPIAVGTKVKARSRIFGEDWAKEKYGVGPTGWTTKWEFGCVMQAKGHHLWLVKFDDDSELELLSRQLVIVAADGVQYDEDDADQADEDYDESNKDLDEERIALESDESDSDDDTPLSSLLHQQRAGKILTWEPAASGATISRSQTDLSWLEPKVNTSG